MKEYIVTKDILNIRSKPSDESDDTFMGQLLKGDRVWLEDDDVAGVVPKGGESNVWKIKTGSGNVVAKDGVVADSEFWIKEYGIDDLWKFTKGEGVGIIFLDTGISDCPDLSNAKINKYSIFDSDDDKVSHGSLMASIVAGNGTNILGIAPDTELSSVKIFDGPQVVPASNILNGLNKIFKLFETGELGENKIYIVNCSLTGLANDTKDIQDVISALTKNNQFFFVSAVGNNGYYERGMNRNYVPARLQNVISIAGLNKNYKRLSTSNYWKDIDIVCPGEFVSTYLAQNYITYESAGSSHACAFASGMIALLLSKAMLQNIPINFEMVRRIVSECTEETMTATVEHEYIDNILKKQNLHKTFSNL
jgi:subtilisin family serine protease